VADDDYNWEAIDASEAPETVVLLGAGASADAGIPVATQLYERIAAELPAAPAALYRNIAGLVFQPGEEDVERLFRIIQFINTVETRWRPTDTRLTHESLDLAELVGTWKPELQKYLDDQGTTTQGTPTGRLMDALYDALWKILWVTTASPPDLRYLKCLLLSMRGGTIVTLNYDNTLDEASLTGVGVQLDGGPHPEDVTIPMPGRSRQNTVRVIRLHGSLGWDVGPISGPLSEWNSDKVLLERLTRMRLGQRPPTPAIIFGAGNKLRPDGPYLDLYFEFKQALSGAKRLIVIGYGWADAHVNEVLAGWLQSNGDKLFRVSSMDSKEVPSVVQPWVYGKDKVKVEVEPGRARNTIEQLIRPTPSLQR
jgi:hypothetical protein